MPLNMFNYYYRFHACIERQVGTKDQRVKGDQEVGVMLRLLLAKLLGILPACPEETVTVTSGGRSMVTVMVVCAVLPHWSVVAMACSW